MSWRSNNITTVAMHENASLTGQYIQCILLHETPTWICTLASRLSHESWEKMDFGLADHRFLRGLINAGDEHAKGMRGKQYTLWIEAPRYWWAEMDTYRIGTEPLGSTSTMHKEARGLQGEALVQAKESLTEGTMQARIWVFSWHTLRRIVAQRKMHRLPIWKEFCGFAETITAGFEE